MSEVVRESFMEKVGFELSPKGLLGFGQAASGKGILNEAKPKAVYKCQIV